MMTCDDLEPDEVLVGRRVAFPRGGGLYELGLRGGLVVGVMSWAAFAERYAHQFPGGSPPDIPATHAGRRRPVVRLDPSPLVPCGGGYMAVPRAGFEVIGGGYGDN